jgi:hypothetical protein
VRDVSPSGGRLLPVLFSSCEVEHEVLPTTAARMAVTLWAFANPIVRAGCNGKVAPCQGTLARWGG